VGLGCGGFVGGLIVTTTRPSTFTVLFLLNATTFLLYAVFLTRLRLPVVMRAPGRGGGYREVLADRVFLRLIALNFAFVVSAAALLNGLFPVFSKNEAGVSEATIGLLFLLNALVIIGAQLPIAKAIEGHRRSRGLLLMSTLFAGCWVLVELAGTTPMALTLALLVLGIFCLSLGECLYDAIYGPLVADLAPENKTGRYMAASGLSWQLGFITVPAVGGAVLGAEPFALWPLAALVALAAGAYSVRLETHLPPQLRRTPQLSAPPQPAPSATVAGK